MRRAAIGQKRTFRRVEIEGNLECKRNQHREPMIREIALAEMGTVPNPPERQRCCEAQFEIEMAYYHRQEQSVKLTWLK